MLKGVKNIVAKLTVGDEFGLYREAEGRCMYLLFVYDNEEQALVMGERLAKLLGKSFVNEIDRKTKQTKTSSDVVRRKK